MTDVDLMERAAIREYLGGQSRDEAERAAYAGEHAELATSAWLGARPGGCPCAECQRRRRNGP